MLKAADAKRITHSWNAEKFKAEEEHVKNAITEAAKNGKYNVSVEYESIDLYYYLAILLQDNGYEVDRYCNYDSNKSYLIIKWS